MARNENPPFSRGETLYAGNTIDTNDLMGVDLVGKEWLFEDRNANTGFSRTNQFVKCRVVRNDAAFAILPKRLAIFSKDAGEYGTHIDGMNAFQPATFVNGVAAAGTPGFPVDEYLPAAGVTTNDCCWLVMEGPAVCITSLANMSRAITVGERISGQTAATTNSTTAGRIQPEPLLNAATSGVTETSAQFDVARNQIGRALTAKTANETNDDVLVNICKW